MLTVNQRWIDVVSMWAHTALKHTQRQNNVDSTYWHRINVVSTLWCLYLFNHLFMYFISRFSEQDLCVYMIIESYSFLNCLTYVVFNLSVHIHPRTSWTFSVLSIQYLDEPERNCSCDLSWPCRVQVECLTLLQIHVYWKHSPPETGSFQIKILIFFISLPKT